MWQKEEEKDENTKYTDKNGSIGRKTYKEDHFETTGRVSYGRLSAQSGAAALDRLVQLSECG